MDWRKQVRLQMWKLLQQAEDVINRTGLPVGAARPEFDAIMSSYDDAALYYQQREREERLLTRSPYAYPYEPWPQPSDEVDLIEITTFGDAERRYIGGINARRCAYCGTTQNKITNCKNCGAPL